MALPHYLRAFSSVNFRVFFAGQGLSLIGNWMTTTASAWLAYDLTGRPFVVALVAFVNQIPILFLAPAAGAWGDRTDRRRLLLGVHAICTLQSVVLAGVTLAGYISVPWLLALTFLRGVGNAVEFPTRQSFFVELLDRREDIPNAIALHSSMFNIARLVGPSIAGVLIFAGGPGLCYSLDAVSFLAVFASLLVIRTRPPARAPRATTATEDFRAGLAYARSTPGLRNPLLMVALVAMAGFGASLLGPVYARDILHGDARTLGLLTSSMGAGALLSAGFLSTRRTADRLPVWMGRGAGLIAAGQVVFAASSSLPVAMAGLFVNGLGTVLVMAGANTVIQSRLEEDKRSRIMGLFAMAQGMFPIGSLLVGFIADIAGPRPAVLACALTCLGALALHRRAERPGPQPNGGRSRAGSPS